MSARVALLLCLALPAAAGTSQRPFPPRLPPAFAAMPAPPRAASLLPVPNAPAFALIPPSESAPWDLLPPSAAEAEAAAAPAVKPDALASLTGLVERLTGAPAALRAGGTLGAFWSGQVQGGPQAEQRLGEIVDLARASPTARKILEAAERRAGATPVVFARMGSNLGEYDYVTGVLRLNRDFLTQNARSAAATLIHELAHILQHAENVPAEALEMELEAHVVSLRVMEELGVPRSQWDGFTREVERRLKQGPKQYADWLAGQLPAKLRLEGRNFEELAELLDDEIERQEQKPSRSERAQALLEWTRRDAALLRSRSGRRRYARFAARVQALLERESKQLN